MTQRTKKKTAAEQRRAAEAVTEREVLAVIRESMKTGVLWTSLNASHVTYNAVLRLEFKRRIRRLAGGVWVVVPRADRTATRKG